MSVISGCASPSTVIAPAPLGVSAVSPTAGVSAPRFNDSTVINSNTGESVYTDSAASHQYSDRSAARRERSDPALVNFVGDATRQSSSARIQSRRGLLIPSVTIRFIVSPVAAPSRPAFGVRVAGFEPLSL